MCAYCGAVTHDIAFRSGAVLHHDMRFALVFRPRALATSPCRRRSRAPPDATSQAWCGTRSGRRSKCCSQHELKRRRRGDVDACHGTCSHKYFGAIGFALRGVCVCAFVSRIAYAFACRFVGLRVGHGEGTWCVGREGVYSGA